MLPEIVHQPTLHNPFPQISKVAVAPFLMLSSEPTLDGRKVAEAYAAELAEVPGYVVIPVSQVETAMRAYGLQLEKEEDARRLAQILGGRCGRRRSGHGIYALLSAADDAAGLLVHGQPELPSHSGRLWPAVGNGGRERHSRPAGLPSRAGAGERATQDANSALPETAAQSADVRWTGRAVRQTRRLAVPGNRSKARAAGSKQDVRTVSHEAADSTAAGKIAGEHCHGNRAGDFDAWRK